MPVRPLRLWRFAFAACLVTVLVLALLPTNQPLPTTGWDKTDHILAFAVLTLLGFHCGYRTRLAIGLLSYGIGIELLQGLTSYRYAEWRDVVADAMGIAVAFLLARLGQIIQKARSLS
jgi:VanZ family protein